MKKSKAPSLQKGVFLRVDRDVWDRFKAKCEAKKRIQGVQATELFRTWVNDGGNGEMSDKDKLAKAVSLLNDVWHSNNGGSP